MAAASFAEPVCQVRTDASAWRLLCLHAVRVEPSNDLVDADSHARLARNSGPHAALEEAWCEAVCNAREDIRLLEDLAERIVVSISLLPLCNRVAAEDNRVAVVAVGLCDCGLEGGKEGVLRVPQDVPPDGPASAVKVVLVEDDVALDDLAAECGDAVGEHLVWCDMVWCGVCFCTNQLRRPIIQFFFIIALIYS